MRTKSPSLVIVSVCMFSTSGLGAILQDIIISGVMNAKRILLLLVFHPRMNKNDQLTGPPATTGTKALVSQPLTLKLYSRKEAKSFSILNSWLIDSVKALPAA